MYKVMPLHAGDFLLQAANDAGHGIAALIARLQIDQEAAAVERDIAAVDADEGREAHDVRILEHLGGEGLLRSAIAW